MFSFIETKLFTRLIQQYLSEEEYAELQSFLIHNPGPGILFPDRVAYANCVGAAKAGESVVGYA